MGGFKQKKKKQRRKKNPRLEQEAYDYVSRWAARLGSPVSTDSSCSGVNSFLPALGTLARGNVVIDLHTHSSCSDGTLAPSALVERAYRRGVKVLALTDHDTMSGVPEAVVSAQKVSIRVIPGVEISSVYSPSDVPGTGESVHVLAYYGSCGPAKWEKLDEMLSSIRSGRYDRAKNMLKKLEKLKMPIKWESITRIAGEGVAPGRVHVARAMVESGYVNNIREAFDKYLHDNGPAYATGTEPSAETVVQLIYETGGVSALAHPWCLKNPMVVIKALKAAGLHAMEVYKSDGKVAGYAELADTLKLLKIGGSDFHGRNGTDESEVGSVSLPITRASDFLKMARPIWCGAAKEILSKFVEAPSQANLEKITKFRGLITTECFTTSNVRNIVDTCISSWFDNDEDVEVAVDDVKLKLDHFTVAQ